MATKATKDAPAKREAVTDLAVAEELNIPIGLAETDFGDEAAARILADIASATSVDDVFGQDAEGLRLYVGRTITIAGFTYLPSDFDEDDDGNKVDPEHRWPYVVMQAADEDGVRRVITTGAKKCVVQLATVDKLGGFPWQARVSERDIGGGKSVLQFARP